MKRQLFSIHTHFNNTNKSIGLVDIEKLIAAVPLDMYKTCAIFEGNIKVVYDIFIEDFMNLITQRLSNG